MEKNQLFQPEWLTLSAEVRQKLIAMFGIKRDVSTEVCGNQVVCDGYSNGALTAMNLDAIRAKGIAGNDFMEALTNLLKSFEKKEEEVEEVEVFENNTVPNDFVVEKIGVKKSKSYKSTLKQ